MKKNKLTRAESNKKYKVECLQKGDLVFLRKRWRRVRYSHGDTIAFDLLNKPQFNSKLAYYQVATIWRDVKYIIRETHKIKNWKYENT